MMGLKVTSSKRAHAITRSAAPEAPAPEQAAADLNLHRRHSDSVLSQSLWGLRSRCAQGLFEPSGCLWRVWGLIPKMILPLPPSCWGFSLPLDVGYLLSAAPGLLSHHSGTYHRAGAPLPLDMGYPLTAAPVPCRHCYSAMRPPPQGCAATSNSMTMSHAM